MPIWYPKIRRLEKMGLVFHLRGYEDQASTDLIPCLISDYVNIQTLSRSAKMWPVIETSEQWILSFLACYVCMYNLVISLLKHPAIARLKFSYMLACVRNLWEHFILFTEQSLIEHILLSLKTSRSSSRIQFALFLEETTK